MKKLILALLIVGSIGCKGQGGGSSANNGAPKNATPAAGFTYNLVSETTSGYKFFTVRAYDGNGVLKTSTNWVLNNGCLPVVANPTCSNTFNTTLNSEVELTSIQFVLTSNPNGVPMEITLYQNGNPVEMTTLTNVGDGHDFAPGF